MCQPPPAECRDDAECAPGTRCEAGLCVLRLGGCRVEADCSPGDLCESGLCTAPPPPCPLDAHEPDDDALAATPLAAGIAPLNFCEDAVDWLSLQARAGAVYALATSDLSPGVDTVLEVYDTQGRVLLAGNDDASPGAPESALEWQAPETGRYAVLVRDADGAHGPDRTYRVSITEGCVDDDFEPDDTSDVAAERPVGGATERRRHCDADWVRFAVEADHTYTIATSDLSGGSDTALELYAANGRTLLAGNDDVDGGLASRLTFTADADGERLLRVASADERYGGERAYRLSLRDDGSPPCEGCPAPPERCVADADEEDDRVDLARTLTIGRPRFDRSFCEDAGDWLDFDAQAGRRYDLQTFALGPLADTVLEVYGPGGQVLLARNDDGGDDGGASRVQGFEPVADGVYTVLVRSVGGAFGPAREYSVGVTESCVDDAFEHDDSLEAARDVAVGLMGEAHRHCADPDWVRVPVQAGRVYVAQTSHLAGDDDTVLTRYDVAGRALDEDDDGGGDLASRLTWRAESDGVAVLRIGTHGNVYGGARAYQLSVVAGTACDVSPDCPAGQVCEGGLCVPEPGACARDADCDPGFACQGQLCVEHPRCAPDDREDDDTPGAAHAALLGATYALNHCDDARDLLAVPLADGARIDVESTALGADGDTLLNILDTDGVTVLETDDGEGLIGGWEAPADGTFYVEIVSADGRFGDDRDYSVSVRPACLDDASEPDDGADAAGALSLGETQRHALCRNADWVRFEAQAGEDYLLETRNLAGGADTVLDLFAADGSTLLASDDNGAGNAASRLVFTALEAGPHFVRVRSFDGRYGGARAYSVFVAVNAGRCVIDDDCDPVHTCRAGVCLPSPARCGPDDLEDNDVAADAEPVELGLAFELNFCDDAVDWLAFDAQVGQRYDVATAGLSPGGLTNTRLAIFDRDRETELDSNDDGGDDRGDDEDLASLIAAWRAPASGRYFVRVDNVDGRAGADRDYEVMARAACEDDAAEPDDTPELAGPIVVDDPASPHKLCEDADFVSFRAIAAHGYRIETSTLTGGAEAIVTLLSPDGLELTGAADRAEDGTVRLDWLAPADGTFFVHAASADDRYGGARGYSLAVSEIAPEGICLTARECVAGESCVGGRCALTPGACRDVADCPARHVCQNHTCQIVLTCRPDDYENNDDINGFFSNFTEGEKRDWNFCDDDFDLVLINLTLGRRYDFYTERLEDGADPILSVLNVVTKEVLATDDDSGGDRNALVSNWLSPNFGVLLLVRNKDGVSGDDTAYTVGVVEHCTEDALEPDDKLEDARPFVVGGPSQPHALCRDEDWVRFEATAGTRYILRTAPDDVDGAKDTVLHVFDAGGTEVAFNSNGLRNAPGSHLIWTAPETGTYFVRVTAASDQYGGDCDYTLDIYTVCRFDFDCGAFGNCEDGVCGNPPPPACPPDAFEPDDAHITPAYERSLGVHRRHNLCDDATDWVSFDAVAGMAYDIETSLLTQGTDTVLELYTPDGGQKLAEDDDGAQNGVASRINNAIAPFSGRFLLLVRTFNRNFADGLFYTLHIREHCDEDAREQDDVFDSAVPLNVGGEASSRAFCADSDWSSFEAVAGHTYVVNTENLQGGADTVLTLYAPDGSTVLATNDNRAPGDASSVIGPLMAPADGRFYLHITSVGDVYGGGRRYDVRVREVQ